MAFSSIAGSFGALLVGWLVVVARAVSGKTPIYFIDINVMASLSLDLQLDWGVYEVIHMFKDVETRVSMYWIRNWIGSHPTHYYFISRY